ncbi:MAG: DUF1064 domain-containing protein [Clostridia bacterium]|nr:DUF1064 domain-containing protein [Clostridia bacterium]
MSKYGNKAVAVDGIMFASKREAKRYRELILLLKCGKISALELQKKFILQPPYRKNGKSIREITYVADFVYFDKERNKVIVEDSKGYRTEVFKLKKKIFEFVYPELTLEEV